MTYAEAARHIARSIQVFGARTAVPFIRRRLPDRAVGRILASELMGGEARTYCSPGNRVWAPRYLDAHPAQDYATWSSLVPTVAAETLDRFVDEWRRQAGE